MAKETTAKKTEKKEISKKGKVLVTGGAGFIGSNIVDILLENGYEAVIVDNLSTGSLHNINKNAKMYRVDITDISLREVFKNEKPDYVIHEAAQINVRTSVEKPIFDATVNIIGSLNLIELSKQFRVKKFIYASSGGACYGEPVENPCNENHPINPICPYGVSKHAVEHYLFNYAHNFGLNYVVLRYSNVYGPRQDPKGEAGVIAIWIKKLSDGRPGMIFGDGKQTRDFVFVGDVARANLLALEKQTKSKIFNISYGEETSVNELYRVIQSEMSSQLEPTYGPEVRGEVRFICVDNSLAKKELGWKPEVELKQGIRKTIDWFRKKYQ